MSQQRLLYTLIQNTLALARNYSSAHTLAQNLANSALPSILPQLDLTALRLDRHTSHIQQGVGICNFYAEQALRVTAYYLPQGEIMKLHDHPQMEIISYMLRGKMQASVYTHVEDNRYSKKTTVLSKG